MAKTYDVYIAETMYELIYPNPAGAQRRFLHFENVTIDQLRCLKEVANDGGMALAYTMNGDEGE